MAIYHWCPACDRRKAMDSTGPWGWPNFRCRRCTMCYAYSIDDVVVMDGPEKVDPMKDPTAASAIADALRDAALEDEDQSARLLDRSRTTRIKADALDAIAAGRTD